MVNIPAGLDKAKVLAALYNAARPQGMGFVRYDPTPMSIEEARGLLQHTNQFDYLKGRVMKIDFGGDGLDTRLYNRDNGEGAAEMAIMSLQSADSPDNPTTARIHEYGRTNAAHELIEELDEQRRKRTQA